MRNKKAYNEAVKHYNRVAGQIKRYHPNIDPSSYLENETMTEKGVERALEQMRLDAELEETTPELNEEVAKEEDFQEHVDQYKQARDTLRDDWGIDMDETESEIFWRAFDDPDILDAFGSTNVLYMGEEVRDDEKITTKQAAEIAKGVAARSIGGNKSPEDIRNDYNRYYKRYKKLRAKGSSHKDTINRLFKTPKK